MARYSLGPPLRCGLPPCGRHHSAALMQVKSYTGNIFLLLLTFGLTLGMASCELDDQRDSLKKYYFPTESLENGLVYIYKVTTRDSVYEDTWFYKSILEDSVSYFTAQQYDQYFNVIRFQLFRLAESGVVLEKDISYTTDSTERTIPRENQVLAEQFFRFQVQSADTFYSSSIRFLQATEGFYVTKNTSRKYLRDTTFKFDDTNHEAILLDVKESTMDDNSAPSNVILGKEIYASGFGLVKALKNNTPNGELTIELDTIYEMQDFLRDKFSK